MERSFLEQFGLEKEQVDKILDTNSSEIGKAKKDFEVLKEERDNLKLQLDDTTTKLKSFDGVDVETLKGEIATLTNDLQKKDIEYQSKMTDRDFQDALNSALLEAGAINPKAVTALLDIDTLKTSKNQKEDVATAIAALRESDANQFQSAQQPLTFTQPTSGGTPARPFLGGADLNAHRLIK